MSFEERITIDPRLLAGKPVVKGTRISVRFILALLVEGWADEEILDNYPQFEREDLMAVREYAGDTQKS